MQIEIDFEVFKALTSIRVSESDSYNAVIRRLLNLPTDVSSDTISERIIANTRASHGSQRSAAKSDEITYAEVYNATQAQKELKARYMAGAWFGNTPLPAGTRLKATYKGQTYYAEIRDRKWIGDDGVVRNSPSDAANSITNTNVNGWLFWHAQLPGDPAWRRLDELKK